MHGTYRASGKLRCTGTTLATLAPLAVAGVAYRIYRASEIGIADLVTSIVTVVLLSSAMAAGWHIQVRRLRARAEAAEWEAKRARRGDVLLDGEEDRELWASVPAATDIDSDTCIIGPNVVALRRYGYPQAG